MNFKATTFFIILCHMAFLAATAQKKGQGSAPPAQGQASINIHVTNTVKAPTRGETVIFISEKSGKQFSGTTNKDGEFTLQLEPGDSYAIKLKTLNDTTNYSRLEIPALEPGQYFDAPFSVDIQYEPARTYTLNHVYFGSGKPTLRPASFKELDEIAAYMKLKKEQHFEIGGHTDNTGKEVENAKLSLARALAVRAYLVRKGVPADLIIAKGYGSTKPVASNETPEGKQQNRRTEVVFL